MTERSRLLDPTDPELIPVLQHLECGYGPRAVFPSRISQMVVMQAMLDWLTRSVRLVIMCRLLSYALGNPTLMSAIVLACVVIAVLELFARKPWRACVDMALLGPAAWLMSSVTTWASLSLTALATVLAACVGLSAVIGDIVASFYVMTHTQDGAIEPADRGDMRRTWLSRWWLDPVGMVVSEVRAWAEIRRARRSRQAGLALMLSLRRRRLRATSWFAPKVVALVLLAPAVVLVAGRLQLGMLTGMGAILGYTAAIWALALLSTGYTDLVHTVRMLFVWLANTPGNSSEAESVPAPRVSVARLFLAYHSRVPLAHVTALLEPPCPARQHLLRRLLLAVSLLLTPTAAYFPAPMLADASAWRPGALPGRSAGLVRRVTCLLPASPMFPGSAGPQVDGLIRRVPEAWWLVLPEMVYRPPVGGTRGQLLLCVAAAILGTLFVPALFIFGTWVFLFGPLLTPYEAECEHHARYFYAPHA